MDQHAIRTQSLLEGINEIAIIDTHEHIPPESRVTERAPSFFRFFEHYVSSDLVSAGMPREALEQMRDLDNGLSPEARWALMAPYWPFVRTTGYGRAMCRYMRELFGAEPSGETCRALCEAIGKAQRPGWYATSPSGTDGSQRSQFGHAA